MLGIAILVVLALVASFVSQQSDADSPTPSVSNAGPQGLGVLAVWLKESSVPVIVHDAPLTELPEEARVVVLAAPKATEVRDDEVLALKDFVESGGTLIYLVPRNAPQPALNSWLKVRPGPPAPLTKEEGLEDVGGSTVDVTFAGGLLSGAKRLRLSADRTLSVLDERALAVTSHDAVWWLPRGRGEVWLSAGADLAQNARLELADNALFWGNLAGHGPIVFAEFHHRHRAGVPMNLLATAFQLLFLALLIVWAKGPRLGPPRDEPPTMHRSAREYVTAMATLMKNAKVEEELVAALKSDFRLLLRERLQIPIESSWERADAELARRASVEPGALLGALKETTFLALSRRLALLEGHLKAGPLFDPSPQPPNRPPP